MKKYVKYLIYRLLTVFAIAAILYAVGVRTNLAILIAVPVIWITTIVLFMLNARNTMRCLDIIEGQLKHKIFQRIFWTKFRGGIDTLCLDLVATALIVFVIYFVFIDYCVLPLCAVTMSLILNIAGYIHTRNNKRTLYNLLRIKDEDNAQ